ncbi:hypothetical protein Kpol_1035p39 [Vanderwaltozyma polyspora DSM 70294]|uniref:Exonuclease domain-containing protein n=1 Tax=Vanderwaltozyma polyspora (strain ATCC 22028 / DSM 70294 / BCRC 21397 / CBS 2163 / NBRC 10782 / NRRL Y-8283 / UCD 57-17) TaxID=436907 RepID=A7TKK4_VANPO|nr:uncharacterized protein Kpol_1035p39 [Vanderwaltozyma polyspora DSM 70294]EDO17226.1 hypothetical protein Kpol_1035p39 [Vanderwaltozyma polyspora DSM 70294]
MFFFRRFYGIQRKNNYLNKVNIGKSAGKFVFKKANMVEVKNPVVWIDCEMTGLNHVNDHIIEICCIVTDGDMNVVKDPGTGEDNVYESVIHYDEEVMSKMNEWCIDQHGKSGLTEKVLKSNKSLSRVQQELIRHVKKYIPEPNKGVLAGNSVHMDRLFLINEFPSLIDHLFYRIIDVSSIMEVCRRHNNPLNSVVPKKISSHTAKSDIIESIKQLKWYMKHYFKSTEETKDFVKEQEDNIAKLEKQDLKSKELAETANTEKAE